MNKTERVKALIGVIGVLIPILIFLISVLGVMGCSQHPVYHKDYYKLWTHDEFMELREYVNNMHFASELAGSQASSSDLIAFVEALKLMLKAKTSRESSIASRARRKALKAVLENVKSKKARLGIRAYAESYTPYDLLVLEASVKIAISSRR